MSRAATTLQASWRGRQARKDPEQVLIEKLRADIGRLMYPMRTGALRDTALCTLEAELAGKVPENWSNLAYLSTLLSGTPSLITVEGDAAHRPAKEALVDAPIFFGKGGALRHATAAVAPCSSVSSATASVAGSTRKSMAAATTSIQRMYRGKRARVEAQTAAKEAKAAVTIQNRFRGHQARAKPAQSTTGTHDATEQRTANLGMGAAWPTERWPSGLLYFATFIATFVAILVAANNLLPNVSHAIVAIVYRVVWYAVLLALSLYAWLRLPYWLGRLVTHILTHLALQSYPIGFETLRLVPWLSFSPLTLHISLACTDFYMANPPKIHCRDPHLVRVRDGHFLFSLEVRYLLKLIRGEDFSADPMVLRFKTVALSGIVFNIMFGTQTAVCEKNGKRLSAHKYEINLTAMNKQMATNELSEAIGGPYIWRFRNLTLPNVLRLRIFRARRLPQPSSSTSMRPRIEVTLQTSKLSTPHGIPHSDESDGEDGITFDGKQSAHSVSYDFGGIEMLLPVGYDEADALVIVRVYNDSVRGFGQRPALIGQWFMTVKYLFMFPTYCKHSRIHAPGDGSISGTFLLTDTKCRGSAMRNREHDDLGAGFSGELDMALHFTHSGLLDEPLPRRPMSALEQIDEFPNEDKLKMGYWPELKACLEGVPLRFDIEHFALRKAVIEMSDLFAGAIDEVDAERERKSMLRMGHLSHTDWIKGHKDPTHGVVRIDNLDFGRFHSATLFGLMEAVAKRLTTSAVLDGNAISTAIDEILDGLFKDLSRKLRGMTSAAARLVSPPARGLTRGGSTLVLNASDEASKIG